METAAYTIVFQAAPALRSPFSTAVPFSRQLIEQKRAQRVFRGRSALSVDPDELDDFYLVNARDEGDAWRLLDALQRDGSVELAYAAPPRRVLVGDVNPPAPSGIDSAWREQIRLPEAMRLPQWNGRGKVDVAIVDTGCDHRHPQLSPPVVNLTTYFPAGVPYPDMIGHGTHVSGLIGARFDAANGFEGIAAACATLHVHHGMGDPHDAGAYYQALRAARSARLINLSLGGPDEDPLETRILTRALRNGATIVAAIGNDGRSGSTASYPACLPEIIAVGAVDRQGNRAEFSSYGDHIALCAPGVDIWSTVPTYPIPGLMTVGSPPLAQFSGTSMAAPIVTAVVAKMLSWNDALTRDDVRRYLCGTSGQAWNHRVGLGVIDACATLEKL